MKSSFSYGTATLDHDLLHILDDCRMRDICPQSASDPPTYCIRAAGVLRYSRESDRHRLNLTTIPQKSQSPTEYPVQCEYCGEKAHPPLDLTWIHNSETRFCCDQRQQLCQMLVKETLLCEERSDLITCNLTLEEEIEMLCYKARESEAHHKFIRDLLGKLRVQSGKSTVYSGYPVNVPAAQTSVPTPGVLRLRLSSLQREAVRRVHPSTGEKLLEKKEEEVMLPFFDRTPVQFGICYHQVRSEFLQKFYSSGIKFFTMFPDGSAQVFYPSGLLAVLCVVTEHNGRVCIVYDDVSTPNQPIRAVFQSDGRATCYHTNGNIWLSLNMSGGRRLNDAGTTTCRWSWGTLTPLQPIFLSLNESVGVRVLGKKQVFVSFLACGQQVKLSVGTSCAQGEHEHTSGSLVSKDELLALAAKIRIHAAIQHLHQYLTPPSHPQMLKPTPTPYLHVAAQRLLKFSDDVMMSDSDRAFICRCLQDC
ncbi:glutamate-rich protein 6 isoform X2 [Archocentrus centrarchus]|uniref:glutamate-rich protein 6 isoform X2 n=1 Tax=Archocentrus centrarchus TaxID=63155 RepID=UPI0011EA2922|nr:glutamate-rich protein 6 isoform X2 [Archocentrus centrarchus]